MEKILCLIPARSGSKGLQDKNIKKMVDKPLLAWSIEQARQSKYFNAQQMRIIVSTDSEKYRDIALKYQAEVPFLRPESISQDNSTDFMFINHALDWLKDNENYIPDYILQLRPTQPCRPDGLIDKCLDTFIGSNYDSLRTVIPSEKTPYKMYTKDGEQLVPLFQEVNGLSEPFNVGRQYLPKTYLHNGYVDILKYEIIKHHKLSGKILAYEMEKTHNIDIDTEQDWIEAEQKLYTKYYLKKNTYPINYKTI